MSTAKPNFYFAASGARSRLTPLHILVRHSLCPSTDLAHEHPKGQYPCGATASACAMDGAAGMDEDRRVMALAEDLRISSDINPRELLSLRTTTTTPLESNDELDEEEGRAGEEGGGVSSRGGGGVSGNKSLLGRCVEDLPFCLGVFSKTSLKWREDLLYI